MSIYLSVVLPSYNEMKNIKRGVLEEVLTYLKKYPKTWELILSDDGSTDGTNQALKDFAKKDERIRVLINPHRGKGPTVASGMMAAQGEWRLFTDFDQSTPLKEIEQLFKYTDPILYSIGPILYSLLVSSCMTKPCFISTANNRWIVVRLIPDNRLISTAL